MKYSLMDDMILVLDKWSSPKNGVMKSKICIFCSHKNLNDQI